MRAGADEGRATRPAFFVPASDKGHGVTGLDGELETIGGDGPDELGISPGMASTGVDDLNATGDETEEE